MPWKLRVTLFFLALPLKIWCGLTIAEALAKIYDAGSAQVSRLLAPTKPPAAAPDVPPLPAPPATPPRSPAQPAEPPHRLVLVENGAREVQVRVRAQRGRPAAAEPASASAASPHGGRHGDRPAASGRST